MPKQRKGLDPAAGGHVFGGTTRAPFPRNTTKRAGRDDGTGGAQPTTGHLSEIDTNSRARSPKSEIGPDSLIGDVSSAGLRRRPPDEPVNEDKVFEI
jgi:hypothetical protein